MSGRLLRGIHSSLLALFLLAPASPVAGQGAEADPPEVAIGERLFLETRFAQYFAANAVDVNTPLARGDATLDTTRTPTGHLDGPFAGQSINCRACHLVDEQRDVRGGGMRTYADFARRSPIPARADGRTTAVRNSPALVNASLPRPGGVIFHLDGELSSLESLAEATITGRNYGWLADESAEAVRHVARVIREDDGRGALARELGGAYRVVLAGVDPSIPNELRLPRELRIDVLRATDRQILHAVARLIAAYVRQLTFARDESGAFTASPFDVFLARNGLPRAPFPGEPADIYTDRLRRGLARLRRPVFADDGPFASHEQARVFGPLELAGLEVFLARPPAARALRPHELAAGGIGNCSACHPAPLFTDFDFHNTGVTQEEYDRVHGEGRFIRLPVPGLFERGRHPNAYLPATARHPRALEPFRAPADAAHPERADLGLWNVYANPDFPDVQDKLWRALCRQQLERFAPGPLGGIRGLFACTPAALLPRTLAQFKTPALRDLSHSAPYMHDGAFDTLGDVIALYRRTSARAREGTLRNAAPELRGIVLTDDDARALIAFLRALNEDYE